MPKATPTFRSTLLDLSRQLATLADCCPGQGKTPTIFDLPMIREGDDDEPMFILVTPAFKFMIDWNMVDMEFIGYIYTDKPYKCLFTDSRLSEFTMARVLENQVREWMTPKPKPRRRRR